MIRLGEVHKLKPEEFQNKHHFCNIVLELLEAELSSRSYANAITTFTFTASMSIKPFEREERKCYESV